MKKMSPFSNNNQAFTLIELLVVMLIIAALALLLIGNFMSSLTKGRDSKRKGDLNQLRQAVEMYYEDKRSYPPQSSDLTTGSPNHIYINKSQPFIVSQKTYVNRLPEDPNSSFDYVYLTDAQGTYYRLFSCIENRNDRSDGVSQTGFDDGAGNAISCGTGCTICKYMISSPNITPLPTL